MAPFFYVFNWPSAEEDDGQIDQNLLKILSLAGVWH